MVIANRISSVNFFKRINATKSSIAVMAIAMLLTAFACRETVGQEKVPDQPIAQETLVPGVSSLPQENTADSSEGTTPAVAPGAIGKQDGVVTHELDHSRKEETSYEQMLLARPMPMSKAERDFVFSHKAPESIRSWSLDEFQNYVDTTIGASDMMSEGLRWLGVRRMLRHQSKFMSEFLSGRSTGAEKESSRKGESKRSSRIRQGVSG